MSYIYDCEKLIEKINNITKSNGQPGSLQDFPNLKAEIIFISHQLWKAGLRYSQIQTVKREANKLKNKKTFPDAQSTISFFKKASQVHDKDPDAYKYFKKILNSALAKVSNIKDIKKLETLIQNMTDVTGKTINNITDCEANKLYNYQIDNLVNDAEDFGNYLSELNLKTNQIRKFLDTVNRLKVQIAIAVKDNNKVKDNDNKSQPFELTNQPKIHADLILLKQKLAYAYGKKKRGKFDSDEAKALKNLKDVMDIAIEKVEDSDDFERLFQLVESIIAYHKAAGGDD